jgi:hypothetical protein
MTARKVLRVVEPDEKSAGKLTVDQAATSGDHRALLVSMRDRIARAVADPQCPPRDLASLTRRLQDIAREISSLDAKAEQESDDDRARPDAAWDSTAL